MEEQQWFQWSLGVGRCADHSAAAGIVTRAIKDQGKEGASAL